ncbi:cytochrome c [Geobacter pickeringii]|uniref:Cytochrome C n=1 Tax=Geobacter pickeringii TaxID=345632 RepID=A0A0B5BEZ3_9BACT|nr:cytochrome c [Geobacter pickeringii]AJE02641.1 cytochrome C [Geobacter pickeringii]
MNAVKRIRLLAMAGLTLAAALCLGTGTPANAADQATPTLAVSDCVKCHKQEPADIASAGSGHKKITCFDCHASHRPSSKNNIPQCSQCHTGKKHYELTGCLGCHKNPHTPLNITLSGNISDPCLTCHTQQMAQLKQFPSKHSKLFCSTCHNVHGKIPQCTQCHKPHSSEQTAADCKKCHKAHQPKNVVYGKEVPNKDCGACHKKAFDLLAASQAKHKALACVYCHQEKHKMVPACQSCHGVPHPASMMAKFPKCGECHNIAHDLNRWNAPSKAEPKKEGKKKK